VKKNEDILTSGIGVNS